MAGAWQEPHQRVGRFPSTWQLGMATRASRSAVSFQPDRRPRQEAVMVSRCLLWKSFP